MPRMVLVNDVGKDHLEELLDVLEDTKLCSNVRITECASMCLTPRLKTEDLCQVQFKVRPTNLNTIVKELKTHGFSTFDVVDVLSSADQMPRERRKNENALFSAIFPSSRDRLSTMEINNNIVGASKFSFDHVFLIFLASYIASIGLLGDNIVNIIASFFVSPLMSMILASTWGIVIGDTSLFCRAARNMVFGACLAWCNGAMIALLICIHKDEEGLQTHNPRSHGVYSFISINSQQIRDRGPPAAVNLVQTAAVAALSGVSTALGQSSGISSTLTGVTVAASLLPPLVNSGLCTVFGLVYPGMRTKDDHTLHSIALVSFFMYFVTVVFVMVFCYLTFKFKHVGGSSFRIQSENRLTIRERAMSTLQSMSFFGRGSRASVPNPAASPSAESQSLHRPRSEMGTELISASRGGSFADDAKDRKVAFADPPGQ